MSIGDNGDMVVMADNVDNNKKDDNNKAGEDDKVGLNDEDI